MVMPRNADGELAELPFVEMRPGYIQRAQFIMPGPFLPTPWRLTGNYFKGYLVFEFSATERFEIKILPCGSVDGYTSSPLVQ